MASLQDDWKTLYSKTLPSLAILRSPAQKVWPVQLDHCFARIILDNAIGIDEPWTSRLASPAIKNMTPGQLRKCITLGNAIVDGKEDLATLNAISLELRGKKQKPGANNKRKQETLGPTNNEASLQKKRQLSIKSVLSSPRSAPGSKPSPPLTSTSQNTRSAEALGNDLTSLITTSDLSSFRQRVLLALCQIPRGRITTYAALSGYLHTSARAVGNGLRNNPFAPIVPCHRVVAANRDLGGFGGFWGKEGKFAVEKAKLLREEGVIVDMGKGKVEGEIWKDFR
ncbi:MAG: hypothetical protein Q9209_006917 [Squamulea sp. 1 TL-2023]